MLKVELVSLAGAYRHHMSTDLIETSNPRHQYTMAELEHVVAHLLEQRRIVRLFVILGRQGTSSDGTLW